MLDKFAEYLKKARLKKGLSIEQIAALTRIDIKFLEAIDSGNFGFLPDLYVKAFIKQYAKAIDLEEQDTLKKYEEALQGNFIEDDQPKSLLEQKVDITTAKPEPEPEKQIPIYDGSEPQPATKAKTSDLQGTFRILLYAAGVVLVGVIIFFSVFNKSSNIIVEEPPYEKILEETKDRYQVMEEEDTTTSAALFTDSLKLQVVNADSVDSAWVMIIYDDLKKEDFLLYPRNSKTVFAVDNFRFTLGNSGVIVLRLNDELLNFEGKRGSVRHYEINRNGIQRLSSPPVIELQ